MKRGKIAPQNFLCDCACHTDPEVKHPTPCCFQCPICKQQIVAHVYNEHIHSCTRADYLAAKRKKQIEETPQAVTPQQKKALRPRKKIEISIPGSARNRYRKR